MQVTKKNLKASQDKHKNYVNQLREFKGFYVREHVYLCINPKKKSLRIGSCSKLEPQYCGPFEVLQKIGPTVYKLAVPLIVKFHDFFHVSLLKRYAKYGDHVIYWSVL